MSLTCTAYLYSSFFKKFILLPCLISGINAHVYSQNLFANSSFEDLNICTEYHMPCAPEAWFYLKPASNPVINNKQIPRATQGKEVLLVPVENVFAPVKSRSYVYTMLCCYMQKGEKYKMSFYINTAFRNFYQLDIYFSEIDPASKDFQFIGLKPSIQITNEHFVADIKQGWKAVEYNYTATGNEKFCLLGNFSDKPFNYLPRHTMAANGMVYYFIDEIKLQPVNINLTCNEYTGIKKKMYDQDLRHTENILLDSIKQDFTVYTDTLSIPSAYFETARAELNKSFTITMDSLLFLLKSKYVIKIDIIGHTDNQGTPDNNQVLSLKRAATVKKYIQEKIPDYTNIIHISGKGQHVPVADNSTLQGRAKNRRVEIIITYTQPIQK